MRSKGVSEARYLRAKAPNVSSPYIFDPTNFLAKVFIISGCVKDPHGFGDAENAGKKNAVFQVSPEIRC